MIFKISSNPTYSMILRKDTALLIEVRVCFVIVSKIARYGISSVKPALP